MKLFKLRNLATVSAVALCVAASPAMAQVTIESGESQPMDVIATVDNTMDVTITDANFGTIGVTGDGVDQATMVLAPGGAITEDVAGPARIIHPTGTGTAGNVVVANAFIDTVLHISYAVNADMDCDIAGGCSGAEPDLLITDVLDNLDLPNVGVAGTAGTLAAEGTATTTGTGALDFDVGFTVQTEADPAVYESGTYTGTVDITFSY